jgi:hypothetical protein
MQAIGADKVGVQSNTVISGILVWVLRVHVHEFLFFYFLYKGSLY